MGCRSFSTTVFLLWSLTVGAVILTQQGGGEGRHSIPPLVTAHWHQNDPYNGLCPMVTDGNFRSVAGCVSIAASQIVYYWRAYNPENTAFDTPVYPYGYAPVTYSVPAGTPFEWELIKDYYTADDTEESRAAVARMVYVTGTSSWLSYGSSTGGNIFDVVKTFESQYNLSAQYANKSGYSQMEWEQLLYDELAYGRPVLYSGTKKGAAHAVVIDGYDAEQRLFHFNFGWGGDGDGYYTVDDETGMNGYCNSQKCVYGIMPKTLGDDTGIGGLNSSCELQLSRNGDGLLLIEATVPTTVVISRMDGRRVAKLRVDGRAEVSLPHGLYVLNGQKWLQ